MAVLRLALDPLRGHPASCALAADRYDPHAVEQVLRPMAVHADMIPANVAGCLTERRAGDWAPSNAAAPLGGQLAARRGRAGAQNEGMRMPHG